MHQQCSSCWVFCLEASRGMPNSLCGILNCCIPAVLLSRMALRMEWIMNLNVDQPLNGDMTKASMDTQELLCPQHCLMEWFYNTSPGGKEHASATLLLLGFLFGSLAWYARFPLPCYESFLRKQATAKQQPPQTCPQVKYVFLLC